MRNEKNFTKAVRVVLILAILGVIIGLGVVYQDSIRDFFAPQVEQPQDDIDDGLDQETSCIVSIKSNNEDLGGVKTISGVYRKGQDIDLVAYTKESNVFIGWYINNELLSRDRITKYTAVADVEIIASFQEFNETVKTRSLAFLNEKAEGLNLYSDMMYCIGYFENYSGIKITITDTSYKPSQHGNDIRDDRFYSQYVLDYDKEGNIKSMSWGEPFYDNDGRRFFEDFVNVSATFMTNMLNNLTVYDGLTFTEMVIKNELTFYSDLFTLLSTNSTGDNQEISVNFNALYDLKLTDGWFVELHGGQTEYSNLFSPESLDLFVHYEIDNTIPNVEYDGEFYYIKINEVLTDFNLLCEARSGTNNNYQGFNTKFQYNTYTYEFGCTFLQSYGTYPSIFLHKTKNSQGFILNGSFSTARDEFKTFDFTGIGFPNLSNIYFNFENCSVYADWYTKAYQLFTDLLNSLKAEQSSTTFNVLKTDVDITSLFCGIDSTGAKIDDLKILADITFSVYQT